MPLRQIHEIYGSAAKASLLISVRNQMKATNNSPSNPGRYFENRKELDARAAQKIRSGKAKPLTQEMLAERLKPSQHLAAE